MGIKVGDRVRFLNAQGCGVVSKIIGKDMVNVTDEDGFDFPTPVKECVIVGNVKDEEKFKEPSTKEAAKKKPAPQVKPEPPVRKRTQIEEFDEQDDIDKSLVSAERPEGEQLNIYLAFVPVDIKQLSSTNFELYIINDCNYELAYTVAAGVGNAATRHASGFLQPNVKVFIEEVPRVMLNDMEFITVQFLAFKKDKSYVIKPTADIRLRINPVKFCKLHSFAENDFFDQQAMIVPVVEKDELQKPMEVSAESIEKAMKTKETIEPARVSHSSKPSKEPLEIDLHINELVDTTAGMEAKDMLEYQLKKFNEVMQQNLKMKGKKIIFIHGKGDGVLRKAILDELKKKYKHCQYQDASFQQYGFGATQVTIR